MAVGLVPSYDPLAAAPAVGPLPAAFAPVARSALAIHADARLADLDGTLQAQAAALGALGYATHLPPAPLARSQDLLWAAESLEGLAPREQVLIALDLQAPASALALPDVPDFASPSHALATLALVAGEPLPLDARVALARADALPPATAASLTRLSSLAVFELTAAQVALAGPAVDVDLLASARNVVARAAIAEMEILAAQPKATFAMTVCGAFDIDLDGSISSHACPVVLSIDALGDDTYTNNAGGAHYASLLADKPAAFFLDLEGDDTYAKPYDSLRRAFAGGASFGVGLLIDRQGDDVYDARSPAHLFATGSAYLGAGGLIDLAGTDTYYVEGVNSLGANGASLDGWGFLYDGAGDDSYIGVAIMAHPSGGSAAINGGAMSGSALLIDAGGNDIYDARYLPAALLTPGLGNNLGRYIDALLAGSGLAANGGGRNGDGGLLDLNGADSYFGWSERDGAINGGGDWGAGFLADLGGNDDYTAIVRGKGGANGGAATGLGVLIDRGGTNRLEATGPTLGGSNGAASGFTTGARGADVVCIGLQIEDRPNDCTPDKPCGTVSGFLGVPPPAPNNPLAAILGREVPCTGLGSKAYVYLPAVGILSMGSGNDRYEGDNVTQGAGDLAGIGILLDAGGDNTYIARAGSLAQGAGRNLGTGILIDAGQDDRFEIGENATGQGAGDLGTGMLIHEREDAVTTYAAPASARPLYLAGGIGLRTDIGSITLEETLRLFCAADTEAALNLTEVPGQQILVCWPSEEDQSRLANPLTREDLPDAPKPLCALPAVDSAVCVPLSLYLTEEQIEWMRSDTLSSTLAGGILHYAEGEAWRLTRHDMAMYDDGCWAACTLLRNMT